jgi:alkanesulfonate monooxygenase SsuD/methylene tetrahydromethanopterin reductase-like flavin-dependent oxidoreductase (luciferase family)
LGTSVLVAGLHQPFQLARALATLDNASGGRVIAGLGTGWSRDEYAAAGVVPFERILPPNRLDDLGQRHRVRRPRQQQRQDSTLTRSTQVTKRARQRAC